MSARDFVPRAVDCAYRSMLVARVARRLAAPPERESAYLLGLLSEAPQWAELALGASHEVLPHLPAWLCAALGAVAQTSGGSPTVAAVRATRLQLRVATERSVDSHAAMIEERQFAETIRRAWLAGLTPALAGCARALPFLAARLVAAAELQAQFEARLQQEKLAALGELAYGATHEINNPLANISTRAEKLLAEESHPERRRMLEVIRNQALRAHEMIADLMHFARPPKAALEQIQVAPLVAQVLHEYAAEAKRRRTELTGAAIDPELAVWADGTQLGVALGALVRNALEAVGQGGKVLVQARADGAAALIEVIDNGPGFPSAVAAHLFDPFYSGREAGRGLGFGLTKAWRIVTGLGGSIAGENLAGGGARFSFTLPINPLRASI